MDKYVDVEGLHIHYIEEGDASAPLLLMLHGWGANCELFQVIITPLIGKYHVVACDMPGFGKSEEPKEPLDIDGYADFALAFLKAAFPETNEVILLGHSHGGRTIIHLLGRGNLPIAVSKAILVDSAGIVPEKTPEQKRRMKTYHNAKEFLVKTGIAKRHPETLQRLQKKFGSSDYAAASPVMRQSMVKVVNADLREEMPSITVPVLLIWGDCDSATPLSDGKKMEELMPEAGLAVIPGATHFSFLDAPVLFNRILGSFLHVS